MRKRIELLAANEESLQKKLREVRRRLVEQLPRIFNPLCRTLRKSGECSLMRNWRHYKLNPAAAREWYNGPQ